MSAGGRQAKIIGGVAIVAVALVVAVKQPKNRSVRPTSAEHSQNAEGKRKKRMVSSLGLSGKMSTATSPNMAAGAAGAAPGGAAAPVAKLPGYGTKVAVPLAESAEIRALQKFLQSKQLADPDKVLRNGKSASLKTGEAKYLRGKYVGVIESITDGTRSKVAAQIGLTAKSGQLNSLSKMSLFDGASVDQLKFKNHVHTITDDTGKQATVMQVSKTEALQLYYIESAGLWVGNVYSSARTGQFELTGTTRLLRKKKT